MTRILIGDDFCEISGHAPDPVVCHGISAVSQMVGNYLDDAGLATVTKGDGYLRITQHKKCRQQEWVGIMLGAMYRAFADMDNSYPGNLEIVLDGKEDWP